MCVVTKFISPAQYIASIIRVGVRRQFVLARKIEKNSIYSIYNIERAPCPGAGANELLYSLPKSPLKNIIIPLRCEKMERWVGGG